MPLPPVETDPLPPNLGSKPIFKDTEPAATGTRDVPSRNNPEALLGIHPVSVHPEAAQGIPAAPRGPIHPVSVRTEAAQGFADAAAPNTGLLGSPDSAPKSKSSNTLFLILAPAVTAFFALLVCIFIGAHSKSPVPVGRAETVASETPLPSPTRQFSQEVSSANTADSKSPIPDQNPSPSLESSTTQSASRSNAKSESQVAVSPTTMPQSIEVRRAEIVGSDGRGGSSVSPPAGEIGTDGPGAKSTPTVQSVAPSPHRTSWCQFCGPTTTTTTLRCRPTWYRGM